MWTRKGLRKQPFSFDLSKIISNKRSNGQFYTVGNPFTLTAFVRWAQAVHLQNAVVLEPFAGANSIIHSLQSISLCRRYRSYDLLPESIEVVERDTLVDFPQGFRVCVTNPPWLAKNSASRRGLPYPKTQHDDLYKHCLELCLENCDDVAAIIPASFLQSGLFRKRLSCYILLHDEGLFSDTNNPVCLALFNAMPSKWVEVYYDNEFIGYLDALEDALPPPVRSSGLRFNDPVGTLGFVSFDSVSAPGIRFCEVEEIAKYAVKHSSRFYTRISGEFGDVSQLVERLNHRIERFREETQDVFLTPFKGMRQDGRYRRRMEFSLARRFIEDEQRL